MPEPVSRGLLAGLLAEVVVMAALGTMALDLYAHSRVEQLGGVNHRGYRGRVMPVRQPGEFRIAVVGGDFAFGWGVAPQETTTDFVRHDVQRRFSRAGVSRRVTAVNLGALGLPASEYSSRLARFADLAPDVVCLYVDLTDSGPGTVMPPFDSGIARLTGYVPMLPVVLREKALPGADTVGRAIGAADRWLYALVADAESAASGEDRLVSIGRAVHVALGMAPVVVVVPVPMTPDQVAARDRVVDVIRARAEAEPRLRVVDLSDDPRLADPALRLDGVNFGAGGQSMVADLVAPAVLEHWRAGVVAP